MMRTMLRRFAIRVLNCGLVLLAAFSLVVPETSQAAEPKVEQLWPHGAGGQGRPTGRQTDADGLSPRIAEGRRYSRDRLSGRKAMTTWLPIVRDARSPSGSIRSAWRVVCSNIATADGDTDIPPRCRMCSGRSAPFVLGGRVEDRPQPGSASWDLGRRTPGVHGGHAF